MPHPREGFSNPTTGIEKMTMLDKCLGRGGGGSWAETDWVLFAFWSDYYWAIIEVCFTAVLCVVTQRTRKIGTLFDNTNNGSEANNLVPRADLGVSRGSLDHPFCLKFHINFSGILSKIKSIYIAGKCPGHPFLNILDPPLNASLLSSAEASLRCREAGEKEKESARAIMGSPARFLFFSYCYFYRDTQREPHLRRREMLHSE